MKAIILLAAALNLAGQVGLIRPQTSPAQAQTQITGKSSIEGTVVDSLSGQPIRKATVSGGAGLNAVTDTSGHFAFRLLRAGRYPIRASSENYPESRTPLQVARNQLLVTVGEDEQKHDVHLELVPGASVAGRVVDEEGNPMRGCFVSAMQSRETESGPVPVTMESGQTDDKGEYRFKNLARGKHYIMARCMQSVPLPHAFVLRSATSDLPSLVYPPRLYPGVADLAAAAKVNVAPGANLLGIDLKMTPATGLTIRGHAAGLPSGLVTQIFLEPRDPSTRQWQLPYLRPRARINAETGEFEIRNVAPGAYDLVASSYTESRSYSARVPVDVGATRPDPINFALTEAPSVSGTISIEGDAKPPINGLKVSLNPLDRQMMIVRPPQADVQSDGSFSFSSVVPGHWRLLVNGGAAYLKSLTLGDQQVSGDNLEIGASAVSLKITMGVRFGQIDATVSDPVSSGEPISGLVWSAAESSNVRSFAFNQQPQQLTNLPPGKYYGCAIATGQPTSLNDYGVHKALESRCAATDLAEGEHATMQMPLISSAELERLIEKLEE